MCKYQRKTIIQHTIALQNMFCKWSWNETRCIVLNTKKGRSATSLFVFNHQYTNKQSWMRWYSAIMNRFRYSHIYTQYEKFNPIFKTWFVKHKISTVQSMNFPAIFGIALLCFVHTPTVLCNLRFVWCQCSLCIQMMWMCSQINSFGEQTLHIIITG